MPARRLIATAALMLYASQCAAQDDYDIKVYPCPRVEGTVTIDGALDDAAWEQAPLVGGFTHYNKPELVEPQAFVRLLFDAERLYFGITCDEPLMDKLVPVAQARDSREVFHGETIELFVDPKHSHSDYYQFGINAAGSVYDSRVTDAAWSADVKAATKLGGDAWTLEVSIPWKDLGVTPKPGMVVGFNVCRNRYVGGNKQWTNWAQTKANFHDPIRFGHAVLAPSPEQLGALGSEFRKGERQGPIRIYGHEGFSDTSYRALASDALGNLNELLAALGKVAQQEGDAATRAELTKRLGEYSEEIAPFEKRLADKATLDAAEWMKMDLRVAGLVKELDQVIWDARLTALLGQI